jgi:hypothetical protein
MREDFFELIDKNFEKYFVNNITKANWVIISYPFWAFNFRDKGYVCVIKEFGNIPPFKKLSTTSITSLPTTCQKV